MPQRVKELAVQIQTVTVMQIKMRQESSTILFQMTPANGVTKMETNMGIIRQGINRTYASTLQKQMYLQHGYRQSIGSGALIATVTDIQTQMDPGSHIQMGLAMPSLTNPRNGGIVTGMGTGIIGRI